MSNKKGGYKECTACKGFGLVKKEYIPCAICTKYKLTSCVQCENKKLLGLYQECLVFHQEDKRLLFQLSLLTGF